ncbi:O-acetylhomoserine (thiol)-lyase [Arthroderma uncinatum]|uniref:O-acetylhomoserine (thiol)-lyase n=1 Tax=Arthroderma uncinatum TaxID=74035 RepID=UPI00144A7D42|nr:O-acetylhomoserine (thiol)-lyase [Arthroderma uncinatum]KAF3479923.1 O-acetylhomoserine (thiol)-lyase [Arthroderma uncinatum]
MCDINDVAMVEQLIDEKTKLIFTESLGNPNYAVPDFESLAKITHKAQLPLVVDATFTAGGCFCQPASRGADIIIHSATKWISGSGTSLGAVVIEAGQSDWQANAAKFPELHGLRPGREGCDADLYTRLGRRAFIEFLRWDTLRDTGSCLSPFAAQQLFAGVESMSLRCARQAANTAALAVWLRDHPRVAWVRYLGFEDHPYHQLACKYFRNGFGTVLTFGLKGGSAEGFRLMDAFKLIINATHVSDPKTIIGHHWSTTHKQCTPDKTAAMGVFDDLFRLSLGIEDIRDLTL